MRMTAIFAVTAALAAPPALAASDQASFAVSARVESLCTVGDRQARVEVRCTRGTTYNLSLGRAASPDSARVTEREPSGVVTATITY